MLTQEKRRSEPVRWHLEFAIGLVSLTLVVVLAYSNVVFRGESLVATANVNPIDDRLVGAGYENWHDQGAVWWQWEPAGQFFSRAYRAGEFPLWDPTVAGGVNTHVNVTQGQYFLPYLLLLVAGNSPLQRDAYYLLMLIGSGLACFLLLRRNGFHLASALFMGTSWILGGTMTQNVNALIGQTYATLPWLVLAVDVLLDTMRWRAFGGAALLIGLSTYSSFLPIVVSGYLLVGIQTVVYIVSARPSSARSGWPRLIAFSGTVLIALGIAAFLLLPLVDAQRHSTAFQASYAGAGAMHYSWDVFPTLFSPRLFYDVWQTMPNEAAFIPMKSGLFDTHFFYIGVAACLLVSCLRNDERQRIGRLQWFFAVAAILLLAKLMGIWPIQWIAYLPVFNFIHFTPYFSGAFGFAVIGLAACGVEALVTKRGARRQVVLVGVCATTVVTLIPLFVSTVGFNQATTPATTRATTLYLLELTRVVLVAGGVLAVVWLRSRRKLGAAATGTLLIGLVCLELGPLASHNRLTRRDVWNTDLPAYVRFIKSDPGLFRVNAVHYPTLVPNTFQGVGIAGISSLGVFNQSRYSELIDAYFKTRTQSGFIVPIELLPHHRRILDLLNVKYLVTYRATPENQAVLTAAGLSPAMSDGQFAVFRNPTAWPRAFVVHDYRVVENRSSAIRAAASGTPEVAILENRPGFPEAGGPATLCQIVSYKPNRVRVVGNDATAGMLVLLDSFGEGWTAHVNGQRSPIVPAYAAFRGVEVPAGRWEVTMDFAPPRLRAGAIISAVSIAVALIALCSARQLPGSVIGDSGPLPADRACGDPAADGEANGDHAPPCDRPASNSS